MSKKVVDVDNDLTQHKAETADKFSRLELRFTAVQERMESMQAETNQRMESMQTQAQQRYDEANQKHAEMMAILINLQRKQANPPPPPSQQQTNPVTIAAVQTISTVPQVVVRLPPPPPTGPQSTPVTTPLRFDDLGFPLFSAGVHSSNEKMKQQQGYDSQRQNYGHDDDYDAAPFGHRGRPIWPSGSGSGSVQPGDRTWTAGSDHRLRKLKMPEFDGEDAYGWVYRAERFFDVQGFANSADRLRAAVICLEGPALAWYRWSDRRDPFRGWDHLKVRLLERFQPSQDGNLHEQFLNISQHGTAREYVSQFESMAAQLDGISEQVLEGTFIKGLQPDIRSSVRLLQPVGLNQVIKLTLMIDESRSDYTGDRNGSQQTVAPTSGGETKSAVLPATGATRPPTTEAKQPLRRMTETEYAEKRAKGICFRCDGRFTPGHRCPEKTLQVLMVTEVDEMESQAAPWDPGLKID